MTAFELPNYLYCQKQNTEDSISEAAPDHGPADNLFHGSLCGPIAATVNEAMFSLVISKWRETFEGLKQTNDFKSLSAAGSLIKNMVSRKPVAITFNMYYPCYSGKLSVPMVALFCRFAC